MRPPSYSLITCAAIVRASAYDGLSEGDGILWRNNIEFHMTKSHVLDGLSNTFLLGEDVAEDNCWLSWPYSNNAHGTCAIPPNYIHAAGEIARLVRNHGLSR